MAIADNLSSVLEDIQECRIRHGVEHPVDLLAVSKTKPYEDVMAAYEAGQRLFGESYAQEACAKIDTCRRDGIRDITWFFIGPLQSNKTRPVAERFDWVMSCDREKILRRLNEQRPAMMRPLNVCLQVNISGEEQKSGAALSEAADLAAVAAGLPHLCLRGLMGIALDTRDQEILRNEFSALADLFRQLRQQYPSMDTLSMGMTADMEAAIAAGSTQVRIGTRIFGARSRPD